MTTLKILLAILILGTCLSACGQRVYPEDPAGRVHDSHSY
jgi:hypothetical protein